MRWRWQIEVNDPDMGRKHVVSMPAVLPFPLAMKMAVSVAIVCDRRGCGLTLYGVSPEENARFRMLVRDRLYYALAPSERGIRAAVTRHARERVT